MLNYLKAELYRLLHKKSLYAYLGALALAYAALAFIRTGGMDANAFSGDTLAFSQWLPLLLGGFLFAAIFTDELGAKSLTIMVGHGLGKGRLVLAKVLLMAITCAVLLALVPLFIAAVLAALGFAPGPGDIAASYALMLKAWMIAVAYSALAAIVAYASQRVTFAIVAYLFLSVGIISGLVGAALDNATVTAILPDASSHLLPYIGARMSAAVAAGQWAQAAQSGLEWLVYVVIATAVAAVVFKKREMEF
jgi:ABC-type transport system involved in multi-copper enzyme maturation permease subunit